MRYTPQVTCLLTFVTGAVEVVLVANSVIDISVGSPFSIPQMFSARLGIATMAICPIMVSFSVAAINSLMKQVALRAELAVERFDRRWNTERTVLLRLPQEDMCQTFGLPSSVKYESDGGPGIAQIMAFLMGSSEALKDRYDFMKFQVFQWLIGATDGHAKNFSVFIQAGGSYRLTPFYDIISAFPVLGGTGIHISDLKLAMGLNASKGKKTAIDKIYPRHFLATAKVLKFPEVQMHEILSDFARMIPAALDNVKTSLPTDFPENVVTAVETNVLRLHDRLSREYGIK